MGEEGEKQTVPPLPPSAAAEETRAPELESDPPTPFDPSRMASYSAFVPQIQPSHTTSLYATAIGAMLYIQHWVQSITSEAHLLNGRAVLLLTDLWFQSILGLVYFDANLQTRTWCMACARHSFLAMLFLAIRQWQCKGTEGPIVYI
ncbi:hypothetical protein NC652_011384 [Populus alba x Populus x berolinensis]|nr:hypothetical protein NC652_011384 [Populus alba x Populus x berolinensis]